ncbi:MAG: hypothetical protein F4139_15355 [Gemmatimonadetes bacterium]|nr:hypothetical protein [Gemmatimonadota bacterium]MYA63417.1 hypothetical protein [Gemmatimonadota bacterium]MYB99483.1 hypothetical protein [Gemmatimonadota bacterium]MYH54293.1 hypothetical protein [Gemmatimonadota bacterium]MYK66794.1 hypothetical protein [Gemmatimonadota bacterium]
MRYITLPPLLLACALLPACTDTAPSAYPDLTGDYVGTGVWRSENRHNLSVLVLTVDQNADSIHGSGLISGMLTSDEGTVTYENDYVFGGTVAPGDPHGLTVSFNSGCVWNTYHGHVTEGGDMVLVGTALGTSEDCSLTGDDSEGLMYFGRKDRGTQEG